MEEAVTALQILSSMMILHSWIPAADDACIHRLRTNTIVSNDYPLGQMQCSLVETQSGQSRSRCACQYKQSNMWVLAVKVYSLSLFMYVSDFFSPNLEIKPAGVMICTQSILLARLLPLLLLKLFGCKLSYFSGDATLV